MANPTNLYSYKNEEPNILPDKIRLSNGKSRTDNSTFTEDELKDAGFMGPYIKPSYDIDKQRVYWDRENLKYIVENLPNPPEETEEQKWEYIRNKRNLLLQQSDWTQLLDSQLDSEIVEEYKIYRESLRNIPQIYVNADDVIWKEQPHHV
jgi:hypothetical protein